MYGLILCYVVSLVIVMDTIQEVHPASSTIIDTSRPEVEVLFILLSLDAVRSRITLKDNEECSIIYWIDMDRGPSCIKVRAVHTNHVVVSGSGLDFSLLGRGETE